jgi:hypothetical protein
MRAKKGPVMIPVPRPSAQRGDLRSISGSDNDDFSNVLLNQVAYALWLEPCDADERKRLVQATLAAMIGMKPRDELEGMLIAQLIASYSAAMEWGVTSELVSGIRRRASIWHFIPAPTRARARGQRRESRH